MEQMLWDAACKIRGEREAAKFKDYLLPILFLKRLSDVFDDEIDGLAKDYGTRKAALEVAENDHEVLRFFLPEKARWSVISGRKTDEVSADLDSQAPDVGERLNEATRALVQYNPSLSDVIDVVNFSAERNGERDINPARLSAVIEIFSDPQYRLGLNDVQPDYLGRAYEYLLRKFAEGAGQSAGEFFTPIEVGLLMAHILRPKPGEECHDFACGSAGLLIKLQLAARQLHNENIPLKLFGQEITPEGYAMAKMNAIIHDMDMDIERGDTMISPKFKTRNNNLRKFDVVIANPMWNQNFNPSDLDEDMFGRFSPIGRLTTSKGDWAWLQHAVACLNDRGRATIVLDTGAVTRGSMTKNADKELRIRKWFVDNDLIQGVILLPSNLFYNTSAAGIIIILSKFKSAMNKGKIVLFDASHLVKKGKPKNYIPQNMITKMATKFRQGKNIAGEIVVISKEQAAEKGYNLLPSYWVTKEQTELLDLSEAINKFKSVVDLERKNSTKLRATLKKLENFLQ